ncbi:transposase [Malonomonas rubra]|uniref:RNA-guided endonuclease InsQ/TnpB family protein n=1 Tax=Malonomonas rubra TaxID=57040 RepID=UPI0026F12C4B|nr:transposase [Malonomonas rubra]
MIKARQVRLKLSPEQEDLLREYQLEAAKCWNEILVIARDFYQQNDGKWISKNDLQKALKNQFKLHSQTVQALTDKFCANRKTTAELRRGGDKKAKYPYREKKFLTIPFKQMAIKRSEEQCVRLTLSKGIHLDTKVNVEGDINTAEILWSGCGYTLSYTADFPLAEESGVVLAGGDIGEIHPIAVCAEDGEGLVVSGREIRSIKQLRNKALARLARMISRCKKGSRRFKKLVRARARLISKTDNQLRDLFHQATRKAINWCIEKSVVELIIGDPQGVEQKTKKKKRLNRKCRQKVSQMEYGRVKDYLTYKAKEAGIKSCFVNERGTSKECPECGLENHVSGRIYRCKECGFEAHRDGKASFLMIRKKHKKLKTPDKFTMTHTQCVPKYRKRRLRERLKPPACVVGPGVVHKSLGYIVDPLDAAFSSI